MNVNQVMEESRFTRFHFQVLLIGFLLIVFDGYDLAILGAVIPVLLEQWSISPIQASAINTKMRYRFFRESIRYEIRS